LTEARESETIKFQGKLEPSTGIEKDPDKETFILTMTQLIAEYVQEQFYYIEPNNKFMNVLENYHIITVQNMIESYKSQLVGGKPESFDHFEL